MFKPQTKKSRKGISVAKSGREKGRKGQKRFFKKEESVGKSEKSVNRVAAPDREQGTIANIGTHRMESSGLGLSGQIAVASVDGAANKYAGMHNFVDPCFFAKWPELARLSTDQLLATLRTWVISFSITPIKVEGPCMVDARTPHWAQIFLASDLKKVI